MARWAGIPSFWTIKVTSVKGFSFQSNSIWGSCWLFTPNGSFFSPDGTWKSYYWVHFSSTIILIYNPMMMIFWAKDLIEERVILKSLYCPKTVIRKSFRFHNFLVDFPRIRFLPYISYLQMSYTLNSLKEGNERWILSPPRYARTPDGRRPPGIMFLSEDLSHFIFSNDRMFSQIIKENHTKI